MTAMDFPSSPSVGSRHTVGNKAWEWDGSTWNSVITKEYIDATLPQSETPPSSPSAGDTWFKTSTGQTYTYYDSYWVEFGRGSTGTGAASEDSWGLMSTENQTFSGNKTFTGSISSYNWQSPNYVVNGAFNIYQRPPANGLRPAGYQGPDRWIMSAETEHVSYEAYDSDEFVGTSALYFSFSGAADAHVTAIQEIKTDDYLIELSGKTVTLSAIATAGNVTDPESLYIRLGINGGFSAPINITAVEEVYHITTTLPDLSLFDSLEVAVEMGHISDGIGTGGGTSPYITNVQLELGSLPTRFRLSQGSYQNELAECQKYFYSIKGPQVSTANPIVYGSGWNNSTSTAYHFIPFPQTMVRTPTALITAGTYSMFGVVDFYGDVGEIATSVPVYNNLTSRHGAVVETSVASSTLVQGRTSFGSMRPPGVGVTDRGYLAWSAED